jgi:RelB Antitoxin alpha helical domain
MTTIEQLTIRQSRRYANEKIRNLPSELQQVLTFAEFLEFKQQQLEDEGLLKVMQETKDDETVALTDARLYLNR